MIPANKQIDCAECVLKKMREYFVRQDLSDSALAFSGGLDSSILLKFSEGKLDAYTLGSKTSIDIRNAKKTSALLNCTFKPIYLENMDLKYYVDILKTIDPTISKLDLSYELVLAILLDHINENTVFTGQGADELFYGYNKFYNAEQKDNSVELNKLYNVTLPREKLIANYFHKSLKTPYLSAGINECLIGTTKEDHIGADKNKVILRLVAGKLGLPDEVMNVPKKAAQYGSGVSKILRDLSKTEKGIQTI